MGTYVYTRRAKVQKMELDGEIVDVGLASYAYKATGWPSGKLSTLIARFHARAWDMSVKYPVDYITYGDSFKEASELSAGVYKISGMTDCYDSPKFAGEFIGHAKKNGRKYNIERK